MDLLVKLAEGMGFTLALAVVLYRVLRGRDPVTGGDGTDQYEEVEEKPLPRLPLIGCFILLGLIVFGGFAYVIVKHIL